MMRQALSNMDQDCDITVETYSAEDLRGTAARAFYRNLGFTEGERKEAFGTPVQEAVLKRGEQK